MIPSHITHIIISFVVAIFGLAQSPTPAPPQNTKPIAPYSQRINKAQRPPSSGALASQPSPVVPTLTVDTNSRNPVPNQLVHFTVTSNIELYRRVYYFEWGDNQPITESETPAADHSYSTRGPYTVQVTAKSLATGGIEPVMGKLEINVRELTLAAEPPNARIGEQVRLVAKLDPPDESARYHFYFDDKTDVDSGNSNESLHPYAEARSFHPRVVAYIGENNEAVPSDSIYLNIATAPTAPPETSSGTTRELDTTPKGVSQLPPSPKQKSPNQRSYGTGSVGGRPPSRPTRSDLLLTLGAVLAALLAWRLMRRPSAPELRVIPHPDAGVHEIVRIRQTGPHTSLRLKPGMDLGEDRISFHKSSAAD